MKPKVSPSVSSSSAPSQNATTSTSCPRLRLQYGRDIVYDTDDSLEPDNLAIPYLYDPDTLTVCTTSPMVSLQPCLPLLPRCRRACHGRHRVLPTWESPRPSRWLDDSLNALGHAHEPTRRLAEPSPLGNASAATPSLHAVTVAGATHGAIPFRPSSPGRGSTTTGSMSAMPWNAGSHRL